MGCKESNQTNKIIAKPTCHAFSAWLNTVAIRSLKLTGKAIMLCSYCVTIMELWKTDSLTKSESMKSATAFLPMSSASIRSLAMPGLAGTPKDKKYSSLSSKLELKGLVEPETASSTRSTLHLSRLNISFQCIEELFQNIELWCDEHM